MVNFSQLVGPIFAILLPKRYIALAAVSILTVCMGLLEMGVAGSVSLLGVAMSSPDALKKLPGYDFLMSLRTWMEIEISPMLYMLIVVMCIVTISIAFKNIILSFLTWKQNCVANNISWDCMRALYNAYLKAPYTWHIQQNSADLQMYLTWKYYTSVYILNFIQVLANVIIVAILIVSTCIVVGFSALIMFLVIGLIGLGIYVFFQKRSQAFGKKVATFEEKLFRSTAECLRGIQEVLLYHTEGYFFSVMAEMQHQYVQTTSVRDLMGSVPQWILESLGTLMLLLVLIATVLSGSSEAKVVGTLMLLAAVCWRMLPATNKLLGSLLVLKGYHANFQAIVKKIFEIPLNEDAEQKKIILFQQKISAHDICFRYPNADDLALKNVSFEIKRTGMIGIVGTSGAGKSTLVGIISGLLSPTSGHLVIDGAALGVGQALHVGYVPQQINLLDATIAENIAFCELGRGVDQERVLKCCRMASLDFITSLPEGINSRVGAGGGRLSGGQIQRIGIARALYGNPDVLIFDEATSALDAATESAIQQTVESLKAQITIIIIAHRLSTVKNCDYVYWLSDGTIIEEGDATTVLRSYCEFLEEKQKNDSN